MRPGGTHANVDHRPDIDSHAGVLHLRHDCHKQRRTAGMVNLFRLLANVAEKPPGQGHNHFRGTVFPNQPVSLRELMALGLGKANGPA